MIKYEAVTFYRHAGSTIYFKKEQINDVGVQQIAVILTDNYNSGETKC